MYKLRIDRDLGKNLFEDASKEIRDWIVNAIANIVIVDGVIEKHEFVALQEAIELLESRDEVHDLMKKVKERDLYEVKDIKMELELAIKVFFYLAAIAVIDGNLKKSEKELLNACGGCLGLEDDLIRAVTRWSLNQMEINRKLTQDLKSSNNARDRIIEELIFEV
ncbi:MAG: hypothetical protein CL909_05040 [Deltaproteobacteria bacterium]|jgi:uncharacterized membrane protein YebE (DUF533 family)|nr:hypothetical protein [Deltaproteobacteria bacterium]MDP7439648.1 hypothetical protein [SAR324 cluster bacterium]HBR60101.1 hypothetical protein [Deltaproteobacteria bacterium]HCV45527.1 hypothetical protein [Deltaproteobacteria bacterium]